MTSSEEYISKYGRKCSYFRTSAQIQQPFEKPQKHIVPIELIVGSVSGTSGTSGKSIIVFDRDMLDRKSELVWKFIRGEQ